jgi:hypothetical protein
MQTEFVLNQYWQLKRLGLEIDHLFLEGATMPNGRKYEEATMPNGQKYEAWLESKGSGEDGDNGGPS